MSKGMTSCIQFMIPHVVNSLIKTQLFTSYFCLFSDEHNNVHVHLRIIVH